MDAASSHLLTSLRKGTVLRRCGGRGRGIAVFKGQVWLTQSNDYRDLIIEAGESFIFDRPGWVVVQALDDASVVWFDRPAPDVGRSIGDDPPRTADGQRISAFALHRAARDMRHAALARALLRVAGAMRLAWAAVGLALHEQFAAVDDCRCPQHA